MDDKVIRAGVGLNRPGLENFFGGWVVAGPPAIVVDVGPAATAGRFLDVLEGLGVDRVDWVLLTHIHVDHAGALAAVLERYPEARAVCHAKGVRHLVDPSKLWEGSLTVLGELAEAYGRPPGVPPDRVVAHDQADLPGLTACATPGHAPHHVAYQYNGRLFAGEASGNLFLINGRQYLRPATPPRFFLEESAGSVEKLLRLPDGHMYFAHAAQAPSSREMLERFRRQLYRWREIIASVDPVPEETRTERCVDALLAADPEIAAFEDMPPGDRERERFFIANSVRGFIGYLKEQTAGE